MDIETLITYRAYNNCKTFLVKNAVHANMFLAGHLTNMIYYE